MKSGYMYMWKTRKDMRKNNARRVPEMKKDREKIKKNPEYFEPPHSKLMFTPLDEGCHHVKPMVLIFT